MREQTVGQGAGTVSAGVAFAACGPRAARATAERAGARPAPALAARRALLAAARRVLWDLLRRKGEARPALLRADLRRRLRDLLRACAESRLLSFLRSAALAAAAAAALLSPPPVRAQQAAFSAIELWGVARGVGGFAARGEGEPASHAGVSVAAAGDVSGDGVPDLIIGGADCAFGCGSAPTYVVFGKPGGAAVDLAEVQAGRGGFAIRGSAEEDAAGSSVSGAGDVNGDGLADLLVGAPGADPGGRLDAGEAYVIFGKPDGRAVELSEVQVGWGGFAIRGAAAEDAAGSSVSGAGDVNGDGLADLLVGAPGADPGGRLEAGEAYVVFGKPDGRAVELSEVEAGEEGFAIRGNTMYYGSSWSISGGGGCERRRPRRSRDRRALDLAPARGGAPLGGENGR